MIFARAVVAQVLAEKTAELAFELVQAEPEGQVLHPKRLSVLAE
jgi:hypothetical protein